VLVGGSHLIEHAEGPELGFLRGVVGAGGVLDVEGGAAERLVSGAMLGLALLAAVEGEAARALLGRVGGLASVADGRGRHF